MEKRCSVAMVEKCGATLDDSHHSLLIVRSIELPFFTTHQKHTVFSVSSELVQVAAPGYYIMNLTCDIFSLSLLDNNFPRSLSPRQMVLVTSLLSYIHHSPPLFSTLRLPTHVPKSFSSFARFITRHRLHTSFLQSPAEDFVSLAAFLQSSDNRLALDFTPVGGRARWCATCEGQTHERSDVARSTSFSTINAQYKEKRKPDLGELCNSSHEQRDQAGQHLQP